MKIAIISPNTKSLDELAAIVERSTPSSVISRHEGGISKARGVAEEGHPDILLVEGMYHDASELSPIEFVTSRFPQTIVILLSSQQTPEFLLNAMRVGVREVLPSPVSKPALEAALMRAGSKLGVRSAQRNARVLAFMAAKGGCGSTFLAANLGYQLGTQGRKVLLVDLNLQFGDALLTVHDRKPVSNIAEVANNLARLDASFFAASVVQLNSNYDILAAPEDPAQSLKVKPEHLDAILNLAVNLYDFVILDLSRTLDDLTIKALDRSHDIFLVVQTLLPCIRNAHRMLTVFRSLGYTQNKVELLVNRYWKNAEIDLEDLRSSLGSAKLRAIPNAYKDAARAINQGAPLATVAKSSPLVKSIDELALSLLPKPDQAQGGLITRLLNIK